MLRTCWVLLLLVLLNNGYGQRGNVWYFGKLVGLDFNQTPPAFLGNGAMIAEEGCASVSDNEGNIILYSNGLEVYNRFHTVVPNGDGLNGNRSSLQGCLIIPQPGNDSLYYLFTTDAYENEFLNGYTYSLINAKKNNGVGEVMIKNAPLWATASERMTAVRHANGVDIWVITQDRDTRVFRSWLINCNGLQTSAVVSNTGLPATTQELLNVGMMKVSPDGKKLCQTSFPETFELDPTLPGNPFYVFDFDNATGTVSNPVSISLPDSYYYTCEFSPNSNLLYVLRREERKVDQFEVKLGTATAIAASRVEIGATADLSGIQLAPDGKIYLCKQANILSCIPRPDIKGTGCGFIESHIVLPRIAQLQLPAFMNDEVHDPYNNFTWEVLDTCSGRVRFTGVTSQIGGVQWAWDFGDGQTSTAQTVEHVFTPANRQYDVKLSISGLLACSRKFLVKKTIRPQGVPAFVDFTIFNRCDSGYVRVENISDEIPGSQPRFIWDFGDGTVTEDINPRHTYTTPGTYTIKMKRTGLLGCIDDSASRQVTIRILGLEVAPQQTTLVGEPTQIWAQADRQSSYRWTPVETLINPNVASPVAIPLQNTWYKVTARDAEGCVATDSVFVNVQPLQAVYVPSGFTPNGDRLNDEVFPFFPATYTLSTFAIYSRWGEKIFQTNRRGTGWDGKLNGKDQIPGVYTWVFQAVDETGKVVIKKGTITLIR